MAKIDDIRTLLNTNDIDGALSLLDTTVVGADITALEQASLCLQCHVIKRDLTSAKMHADVLVQLESSIPDMNYELPPFSEAMLNFISMFTDFSSAGLDSYKNFMETTARYDRSSPGSYFAYKTYEAVTLNTPDFYSTNPTYEHYDLLVGTLNYKDRVPPTHALLVTAAEDFLLKLGSID